ncbi:putative ovule protein [Cocos nucifera]|uniref:Putative ovule protein n=1 Tax=Cocos nucifera TaxID=13894 RepID=A0A8K0HU51_COCNU|nr:putative ovule protein [Cocos nucifera]
MAAGAASFLRCVFAGCIAASDLEIRRRPYHRNCGCALHDPRGCSKLSTCNRISYPVRRSRGRSSVGLVLGTNSARSSPSPSPANTFNLLHGRLAGQRTTVEGLPQERHAWCEATKCF